jgi:hypothetical protein
MSRWGLHVRAVSFLTQTIRLSVIRYVVTLPLRM